MTMPAPYTKLSKKATTLTRTANKKVCVINSAVDGFLTGLFRDSLLCGRTELPLDDTCNATTNKYAVTQAKQ